MEKLFLDENITVKDITIADVKMQKIYLERDRVYMIAQAATYMFFLYLLVGLVGILKNYFEINQFFTLLLMAIIILLIASYPYMRSLMDEKKYLDFLEKKLAASKNKVSTITITKKHLSRGRK